MAAGGGLFEFRIGEELFEIDIDKTRLQHVLSGLLGRLLESESSR